MHRPGINGEGELMGQPANPGSPGKMAIKTGCVEVEISHFHCVVTLFCVVLDFENQNFLFPISKFLDFGFQNF